MNDELAAIARELTDNHLDPLMQAGCSFVRDASSDTYVVDLCSHRNVWAIYGVLVEGGLTIECAPGVVSIGWLDEPETSRDFDTADGPHYFVKALLYGLRLLKGRDVDDTTCIGWAEDLPGQKEEG